MTLLHEARGASTIRTPVIGASGIENGNAGWQSPQPGHDDAPAISLVRELRLKRVTQLRQIVRSARQSVRQSMGRVGDSLDKRRRRELLRRVQA